MKKTLIFDIGGIILDVSNEIITNFLNITEDQTNYLNKLVYGDKFKECLNGKITQQEYMKQLIEENPKYKVEIEKILSPKYQKNIVPFISDTWQYIYSLKNQGYKLYFLSNLTQVTYNYLKNDIKVIDLVDGGIYSWEEGVSKPHKEIYELLLEKYNLNKDELIFFDDTLKNVEMGNRLGIKSILYKTKEDIENNI